MLDAEPAAAVIYPEAAGRYVGYSLGGSQDPIRGPYRVDVDTGHIVNLSSRNACGSGNGRDYNVFDIGVDPRGSMSWACITQQPSVVVAVMERGAVRVLAQAPQNLMAQVTASHSRVTWNLAAGVAGLYQLDP